jgi:hypothetical protein
MHRWTAKANTLGQILDNYIQVMSTSLVQCLDDANFRKSLDASHAAEVRGMLNQCQSFSFFFALIICRKIFHVMGKFSKIIQANDITISSRVYMIECCIRELHNLQTVASFDERYVGKYSSIV